MKGEVYSWRLSRDKKIALEREARNAGMTLAALLDQIAEEWLLEKRTSIGTAVEQRRLHGAAATAIGSISGGENRCADHGREAIRNRLRTLRP